MTTELTSDECAAAALARGERYYCRGRRLFGDSEPAWVISESDGKHIIARCDEESTARKITELLNSTAVAPTVEQRTPNPLVAGSTPARRASLSGPMLDVLELVQRMGGRASVPDVADALDQKHPHAEVRRAIRLLLDEGALHFDDQFKLTLPVDPPARRASEEPRCPVCGFELQDAARGGHRFDCPALPPDAARMDYLDDHLYEIARSMKWDPIEISLRQFVDALIAKKAQP